MQKEGKKESRRRPRSIRLVRDSSLARVLRIDWREYAGSGKNETR